MPIQDDGFERLGEFSQPYRFLRLPAGSYHLTGDVAGHRLWDLTLSLKDGDQITLDLGKENSRTSTVSLSP